MKPREIEILAKPGTDVDRKFREIFLSEEHHVKMVGEKAILYPVTKRGVVYNRADFYTVTGLKLDNMHTRLLEYILNHSTWCLRNLILLTPSK